MMDAYNLKIVLIFTFGFSLAGILGYLSQRFKLSAIVGYLLAGYIIGPYSPGFVADAVISEQLAEIGVILMMFSVGMQFKWQELVHVKMIAIPGAIAQTTITAIVSIFFIQYFGWPLETGLLIGLAIGVSSTVVLVRVLSENNVLNTPQGHIAVGWTIVEDILTVVVLLLLPAISLLKTGIDLPFQEMALLIGWSFFKMIVLIGLLFSVGQAVAKYMLFKVARTHSHELFTLTVMALTFVIAIGSSFIFGTSIALGAFLAGMIIGKTHVRYQATANALPLKDVFVVIFFLSVGMIFNPQAIIDHFYLFIGVLSIILIVKPLTTFLFIWMQKYPIHTAISVSIALAQIGEFSFILSEEALKHKLMPDEAYDIIVACALTSISLSPLLFKLVELGWKWMEKKTYAGTSLKGDEQIFKRSRKAIIVGYGPIGQHVTTTLKKIGYFATIIDNNVDTIDQLGKQNQLAVFGDVSTPNILESAQIKITNLLILTIPDILSTINAIKIARQMNPQISILARARYYIDIQTLKDLDVNYVCCEEEAIKAFNDAIYKIKTKA